MLSLFLIIQKLGVFQNVFFFLTGLYHTFIFFKATRLFENVYHFYAVNKYLLVDWENYACYFWWSSVNYSNHISIEN